MAILKNYFTTAKNREAGGGLAPGPNAPIPQCSLAAHAAERLCFGPRPGEVAQIEAMGYDAWLLQQISPETLDDAECDAFRATLPQTTLSEPLQFLFDRHDLSYTEQVRPLNEVRHQTWARMSVSRRQVLERVVDFWYNHFNIYGYDFYIRSFWADWDRTLRQHALGNFRQLLEATAKHPAMLYYLDNYISTNAGPNENYSREVFELHTLGAINYQVPGGYIDQDVYETSRCFTGWTFEEDHEAPMRGHFKYNHEEHDRFIKFVLGQMIPGDQPPLQDGHNILDRIAFNEGTAKHIALKLCIRFVSDYPSQALVDHIAGIFYSLRFDPNQIRYTIYHLLLSDEFKNARLTKFKRPIDWVVSAMRAFGMPYTTNSNFTYIFDALGVPMFSWRTPDGPPDMNAEWISSNGLLQRWNWLFQIASGWYTSSGINLPVDAVLPADRVTPRQIGEFWLDRLIQRPVSTVSHDAVIEFIADGRSWDLALPAGMRTEKNRHGAALCAMTPEFMYH